ncbi:hypothetical protein ACLOJK_035711 [Asimina triloba]
MGALIPSQAAVSEHAGRRRADEFLRLEKEMGFPICDESSSDDGGDSFTGSEGDDERKWRWVFHPI